jgi:hypothetical protein
MVDCNAFQEPEEAEGFFLAALRLEDKEKAIIRP